MEKRLQYLSSETLFLQPLTSSDALTPLQTGSPTAFLFRVEPNFRGFKNLSRPPWLYSRVSAQMVEKINRLWELGLAWHRAVKSVCHPTVLPHFSHLTPALCLF
jgi:hypothetical protein